jgi:molybdopterin converting factor small subunit
MNVRVRLIGFPDLKRLVGGNEVSVSLDGTSFGDLLRRLEESYGSPMRNALLDGKGGVDASVQVLKNERDWMSRDDPAQPLHEGDEITFMLMVAGG